MSTIDEKSNGNNAAVIQLKEFAEKRMSVTPISYDSVEVSVDLDAVVFSEYRAELYASWSQTAAMRGVELSFTEDDLGSYLNMLIVTRVEYVCGRRVDVKPVDGYAVPSFLSLILSNIGLARNGDMGIELFPTVCKGQKTILYKEFVDPQFMLKMSRAIKILSNLGIEYADGYTRSREGSYDFMSMVMIDDYVKSASNTAHPVYALMASVLGIRGIEVVLSPRVNYGSVMHMKSLIRHLAQTKG